MPSPTPVREKQIGTCANAIYARDIYIRMYRNILSERHVHFIAHSKNRRASYRSAESSLVFSEYVANEIARFICTFQFKKVFTNPMFILIHCVQNIRQFRFPIKFLIILKPEKTRTNEKFIVSIILEVPPFLRPRQFRPIRSMDFKVTATDVTSPFLELFESVLNKLKNYPICTGRHRFI